MTDQPEAHQVILAMIRASYPREMWFVLRRATAGAYHEAWASTRDDPKFAAVPSQRRHRAPQERHFLMESALASAAAACRLPFAAEVIKSNTWVYGMIRTPTVNLMQKMTHDARVPPPAEFRRRIAAANGFVQQGDLFVPEERHASGNQPLYGILIHAPEAQRFADPGYGRPGFARLAFALGDYSGWAATLTLEEIAASYGTTGETKPADVKPRPTWKRSQADKKDGTSGDA